MGVALTVVGGYVALVLALYAVRWVAHEDARAVYHRAITKGEYPPGEEGKRVRKRVTTVAIFGGAAIIGLFLWRRHRNRKESVYE